MKTRKARHKTNGKAAESLLQPKTNRRRDFRAKPRKRSKWTLTDQTTPGQRKVLFPQVRGKIAKRVVVLTTAEYHHISVEFEDETAFYFVIEPGFTVKAGCEYVKNDKLYAKVWPEIQSHKGRR